MKRRYMKSGGEADTDGESIDEIMAARKAAIDRMMVERAKREGYLGSQNKVEQQLIDARTRNAQGPVDEQGNPIPRQTTTLTGDMAASSPRQKAAQAAFDASMSPSTQEPETEDERSLRLYGPKPPQQPENLPEYAEGGEVDAKRLQKLRKMMKSGGEC